LVAICKLTNLLKIAEYANKKLLGFSSGSRGCPAVVEKAAQSPKASNAINLLSNFDCHHADKPGDFCIRIFVS
jgi:hypothetical protein